MFRTNLAHENFRKRTQQYQLSCMSLNRDNSEHPAIPTYIPATYSDRVPLHVEWRMRKAEEEEAKLERLREEMKHRRSSTLGDASSKRGPQVLSPLKRRGSSFSSGGKKASDASMPSGSVTSLNTSGGGGGVEGGSVDLGARASVASTKSPANWLKKKAVTHEQKLQAKQRQSLEAQMGALEAPKATLQELLEEQQSMSNEATGIELSRKVFEQQYLRVLDQTEDLSGGTMEGFLTEVRRITQDGLFEEVEVEIEEEDDDTMATSETSQDATPLGTAAGSRIGQFSRSRFSSIGGASLDDVPLVSFNSEEGARSPKTTGSPTGSDHGERRMSRMNGVSGLDMTQRLGEEGGFTPKAKPKKKRVKVVRRLRTSVESSRALDFNELMRRQGSNYTTKREIDK